MISRVSLLFLLSQHCRQSAVASPSISQEAQDICRAKGYLLQQNNQDNVLQLYNIDESIKEKPFNIDFDSPRMRVRCQKASSELVVRAAGRPSSNMKISLYDFTAGLGRDSLLLASAGYNVVMVERNIVLFLLLEDALRRLHFSNPQLASRMSIIHCNACELQTAQHQPDIIYLDPMYPADEVGRKSLVKKETQVLHNLLGHEEGSDMNNSIGLLKAAERIAQSKIIVKRPLNSETLAGAQPHSIMKGELIT